MFVPALQEEELMVEVYRGELQEVYGNPTRSLVNTARMEAPVPITGGPPLNVKAR
jgi:hypothetical protein